MWCARRAFSAGELLWQIPVQPSDADRITIPEVIRKLEGRPTGSLPPGISGPPGCENVLCSFHGNFVLMPDGFVEIVSTPLFMRLRDHSR